MNCHNLSSKDLLLKHRNLEVPFTYAINIQGKACQVQIKKILRILPGKRIVSLVDLAGKAYLLKLFVGGRRHRSFSKDIKGISAIQQHSINTPDIVASGESEDKAAKYILFEYLESAQDLNELRKKSKEKLFASQFEKVLMLIIQGYQHGILQEDIHLGNFLMSHNKFYWIDGAEVKKIEKKEMRVDKIINNLSFFYAQFPLKNDIYIESGLALLKKSEIGNEVKQVDAKQFSALITLWRRKILAKYRKKVCRDSTNFLCQQNWRQFSIFKREMSTLFSSMASQTLDELIEKGEMIKNGNSATVVKIKIENNDYILKRYNIKSVSHGLSRFFRPTRAWHSWRNAHCLTKLGVHTPEPVFMLENRFGPFRGRGYLLTEYKSLTDLLTTIENNRTETKFLNDLKIDMKQWLGVLHSQMVSHGDMKGSNILIDNKMKYLIDLDSMKFHSNFSKFRAAKQKDCERLERNWEVGPLK